MDAFSYIQTLSSKSLDHLYQDPWACQVVLQCLPTLAKHIVFRMVSLSKPLHKKMIHSWMQSHAKNMVNDSLQKLINLNVLLENTPGYLTLNPTYQRQLQKVLSSLGGSPWENGRKILKDDNVHMSPAELEDYARRKWDSVLHFLVGSSEVDPPPDNVIEILIRTKLMQHTDDKRSLHITNKGYEFMLMDVHDQLWVFVLEYIKALDEANLSKEDSLIFLFQLSHCRTNEYYPVSELTKTQLMLLNDFIDFGLLYKRKNNSRRFYTTSLAVNLIFGGTSGQSRSSMKLVNTFSDTQMGLKSSNSESSVSAASDSASRLRIVVETNFKVYAYTDSSLHIAMLSVFVDIVTRMPNLAIGFITRESLRSALMNGISAQQIYDFMMKHAHDQMRNHTPVIPENIADQLYLWERERKRMQFFESILFDGFSTTEDFYKVQEFAKQNNCFLWSDTSHCKLGISVTGEQDVKSFIRNNIS